MTHNFYLLDNTLPEFSNFGSADELLLELGYSNFWSLQNVGIAKRGASIDEELAGVAYIVPVRKPTKASNPKKRCVSDWQSCGIFPAPNLCEVIFPAISARNSDFQPQAVLTGGDLSLSSEVWAVQTTLCKGGLSFSRSSRSLPSLCRLLPTTARAV